MNTPPEHAGPLWAGVLLATLSPLASLPIMETLSSDRYSGSSVAISLVFGLPVAFIVTCFVALPYVLILREQELLSWFSVCIGTSIAGVPLFYFLHLMFSQVPPVTSSVMSYGVGCGLIAGVAFCIGIWPNSLSKPNPLGEAE